MGRRIAPLPNPGVATNGAVKCNAPLTVDVGDQAGVIVGYCEEWIWPHSRRWKRTCHAGKPHKVTWTDR